MLLVKPTNDTLNYYVGIAYFREGEFDKSIQSMKIVISNTNSTYYQKAEFRLALSYYANDEKEMALPLFKEIGNLAAHEFTEEAKEILINW